MITITRLLEFDYGHRVLGHGGRCRHLHGHRGVVEITVRAPELDRLGMVIDFGLVKSLVGKWIDEHWDHNLLLNRDDPQRLHLEQTEDRIPFIMPHGNPTAENMAQYLYEVASSLLPEKMIVTNVTMFETTNCWAAFSPEPTSAES